MMKLKRETDDNWDARVRRTVRRQELASTVMGVGLGCIAATGIGTLLWLLGGF